MCGYIVTSDNLELARGSHFTTLPGVPVKAGDLVMFRVKHRAGLGRWMPNVGGFNWILQPGLLICVRDCDFRIVGPVIPVSSPGDAWRDLCGK